MINANDLENIYRVCTRNHIARSLMASGKSMDMATFEKQFSRGDLEDAVHVVLVRVGTDGITLTKAGEKMGQAALDAEERAKKIEAKVGMIVGAIRRRFSTRPRRENRSIDGDTLK